MSSTHNSKLISRLYNETNEDKIKEILEEMGNIKDPIFLEPIFDAYKRYKNTSISHYFISYLLEFDCKDALGVAIRILNEINKNYDIVWLLPIFEKYQYYPKNVIEIAIIFLEDISENGLNSEFIYSDIDLSYIYSFLDKAKALKNCNLLMRKIVKNEEINKNIRTLTVYKLLRLNPKEEFQYFIDTFSDINGTDIEILITKEIVTSKWKNGNADKLKNLIKEKGVERSKEILEESEKQQLKEKKVIQEEEFPFAGVINEIGELRNKINTISRFSKTMQINIFNPNELLLTKQKAVKSEDSFRTFCSDFRSIIIDLSEDTKKHSCTQETIEKLLPSISSSDYGKPLNSFFLYLYSNNITVESSLYGLKKLNKFLSLIGHPEAKKQVSEIMKEYNVNDLFIKGEWQKLQQFVLEEYKKFLNSLYEVLSKEIYKETEEVKININKS